MVQTMKKRIPYAVANYEKLVGEGYYFVDKTRFIRELGPKSPVPKRFPQIPRPQVMPT